MAKFDPTAPEVWYPIPGFPAYEFSSHLRVRSYHRGTRRRQIGDPRIIKTHRDDRGYQKLILWDGRKYHNIYVHRLVAEIEYGPCPEGMSVLHRDDDKGNNWPSNLYYGTQTQNVADCKRNGNFVVLHGQDRGNAILTDQAVVAMRRLHAYGLATSALSEAFGVAPKTVGGIVNGDRWPHLPLETIAEGGE